MSEFFEGIAHRVAILFSPEAAMDDYVKFYIQTSTDSTGEETGGIAALVFSDGTKIAGEYQVVGGSGGGYEIYENTTAYSNEDAVKLLDAAEEGYWSAGHEGIALSELLKQANIT